MRPLRTAAVLGVCSVGLALWHPSDHGVVICPTKAVFGFDCPICGGLRAVAEMTRGHPLVAADHNLFVAIAAPIAVAWWIAWWWRDRQGLPPPTLHMSRARWVAVAVVATAFTVLRNLPIAGLPHWLAASAS